jgi:hypothetical protein
MLAKLISFFSLWGVCTTVLFLPRLALGVLGVLGCRWVQLAQFVGGAAIFGFVLALLLQLDLERENSVAEILEPTLTGLIYELFVRRTSLLAFFALTLGAMILTIYYVSTSLFRPEYEPASGLLVFRLPGETWYYVPISPYGDSEDVGGWQNTHIPLQEGDWFSFAVSGSVSPGALSLKNLREIENGVGPTDWPFSGPEGYDPNWYPNGTKLVPNPKQYLDHDDFRADAELTVMGMPHNTVVGIIMPNGEKPCRASGNKAYQRGKCKKDPNQSGYDLVHNKDKDPEIPYLLNFSCHPADYPGEHQASRRGYLWVEINDADDFRWDDAGFFFFKLTKQAGGFHPESTERCDGSLPDYD